VPTPAPTTVPTPVPTASSKEVEELRQKLKEAKAEAKEAKAKAKEAKAKADESAHKWAKEFKASIEKDMREQLSILEANIAMTSAEISASYAELNTQFSEATQALASVTSELNAVKAENAKLVAKLNSSNNPIEAPAKEAVIEVPVISTVEVVEQPAIISIDEAMSFPVESDTSTETIVESDTSTETILNDFKSVLGSPINFDDGNDDGDDEDDLEEEDESDEDDFLSEFTVTEDDDVPNVASYYVSLSSLNIGDD
jgi:F0F1-type ATP synthase membrane subunit b/b'